MKNDCKIIEIETYADLLEYLKGCSPEQLGQEIQILPPSSDGDEVIPLQPAVAIGTVAQFLHSNLDGEPFQQTRGTKDNDHHPEQVVILIDGNPFGPDGVMARDLETGEPCGLRGRDWTREEDRL